MCSDDLIVPLMEKRRDVLVVEYFLLKQSGLRVRASAWSPRGLGFKPPLRFYLEIQLCKGKNTHFSIQSFLPKLCVVSIEFSPLGTVELTNYGYQ